MYFPFDIPSDARTLSRSSLVLGTPFQHSFAFLPSTVVIQSYEAEADNEYVIRGNSAIMKCEIPSFVADFVAVDLWFDTEGNEYYPGDTNNGSAVTGA